MAERVLEQCRLFNEGVGTGDWGAYLDRFGDNATLRIEGDPGSPYVGRDAIAAAYRAAPPGDTLSVTSVESAVARLSISPSPVTPLLSMSACVAV